MQYFKLHIQWLLTLKLLKLFFFEVYAQWQLSTPNCGECFFWNIESLINFISLISFLYGPTWLTYFSNSQIIYLKPHWWLEFSGRKTKSFTCVKYVKLKMWPCDWSAKLYIVTLWCIKQIVGGAGRKSTNKMQFFTLLSSEAYRCDSATVKS